MPVLAPAPWRLIPAHAGKTASERPDQPQAWAHPRSRGENTIPIRQHVSSHGSSPLTRGKRSEDEAGTHTTRLIPAHAGKTAGPTRTPRTVSAHPRSRGENLGVVSGTPGGYGSSPLTRGKRLSAVWAVRLAGLIPAHAGKTPAATSTRLLPAAHPRSRGENVGPLTSQRPHPGSSPLTRGKRHRQRNRVPSDRLIPAHAGKTEQQRAP